MFISYKESQDKIDAILDWANENYWFDTGFVDSLSEQLERKGRLTDNQESALDNLIEKFDINY